MAREGRCAFLKLNQAKSNQKKQRGNFYSCLHFSEVVEQNMAIIMPQRDFEKIKLLERKIGEQKDTSQPTNTDQHLFSYDFLICNLTKKLERKNEKKNKI